MILLDIVNYIGKLHPLIVHLPIGFLVLATIFDLLAYFPKFVELKTPVRIILFIGGLSALSACLLGWMLSQSGDYDYHILQRHKYTGISLAVVSFVLWFLKEDFVQNFLRISDKKHTALLLGQMALLSYSGHQGGNLTHGADYLDIAQLTEKPRVIPTSIEKAKVFEDAIMPILENKCLQCHRKGKVKGELNLQTYEGLLKGGKNGTEIELGNSSNSEIFRRITLDAKHKEFMPTDGKTPLTKEEVALIKWWIDDAKGGENVLFASIASYKSIAPIASSIVGIEGGAIISEGIQEILNPDIPKLANKIAIDAAIKGGFNVRMMHKTPDMLDVSFVNKKIKPDLSLLKPLAQHIVWLNLNELGLDNSIGKHLAEMKNLEKLRLEKNNLSDVFISDLGSLKFLNSINLNETNITSQGISKLKKLENLKRIYAWKTSISPSQFIAFSADSIGAKVILQ